VIIISTITGLPDAKYDSPRNYDVSLNFDLLICPASVPSIELVKIKK